MDPLDSIELAAVVVRVRDIAASVDWWRTGLGIEPMYVGSDGEHPVAALPFGGLTVSLWQLPEGDTRNPEENDRNSYVVCTVRDEPADIRDALAARGVDVGALKQSSHFDFFWFQDPDGNRSEVSRQREGRDWDGTA
ncbi:MAG: VOC family protein [Acidimicrobiia bacterium]